MYICVLFFIAHKNNVCDFHLILLVFFALHIYHHCIILLKHSIKYFHTLLFDFFFFMYAKILTFTLEGNV